MGFPKEETDLESLSALKNNYIVIQMEKNLIQLYYRKAAHCEASQSKRRKYREESSLIKLMGC